MSAVCRKCRRAGDKLFLKGERCSLPKCAMVKKNYPPGQHGNKGPGRISEYGMQLRTKQRLKNIYGIREQQLRRYFGEVQHKKGDIGEMLVQKLEMRLDNVIFRAGLADSRRQARQFVGHGFFAIKGRRVNVPSYEVRTGEEIVIKEAKAKRTIMVDRLKKLEKEEQGVDWLVFEPGSKTLRVIDLPGQQQISEAGDVAMVIEYYSR